MVALVGLITTVIQLYIWALIISVIMTWLIQFNVINTSNRFVYTVGDFLSDHRAGPLESPQRDPVGRRNRPLPIVVILLLAFVQQLIPELILGARQQDVRRAKGKHGATLGFRARGRGKRG